MGLFKSIPTILLENYSVGNMGDGTLLNIEGNKTGFVVWLLDKFSIKSRKVTFTFHNNYVSYITGGKSFDFLPTRDIHNYNIGYSNKKILLVTSILIALVSIFIFFSNTFNQDVGERFVVFFLGGGLSFRFFWLFKRSAAIRISFSCQNLASKGIRIKSGVSGKQISMDDLHKLQDSLISCLELNSKWYNNYFKK
tara:strand:+ start:249 stop:833 length:585 start_codon:yes stop_codon:yes gene_type:complete